MTPPSTASVFDEVPLASPRANHLPKSDVRRALDAAVRRGWNEATRRLARRAASLLLMDTLRWSRRHRHGHGDLVAGGQERPAAGARHDAVAGDGVLHPAAGAPRHRRVRRRQCARASLGRVGGAMLIAATVGWIQAQLFGRISPDLPNKTAYLYSAAVITLFAWSARLAFDGPSASATRPAYSSAACC